MCTFGRTRPNVRVLLNVFFVILLFCLFPIDTFQLSRILLSHKHSHIRAYKYTLYSIIGKSFYSYILVQGVCKLLCVTYFEMFRAALKTMNRH